MILIIDICDEKLSNFLFLSVIIPGSKNRILFCIILLSKHLALAKIVRKISTVLTILFDWFCQQCQQSENINSNNCKVKIHAADNVTYECTFAYVIFFGCLTVVGLKATHILWHDNNSHGIGRGPSIILRRV